MALSLLVRGPLFNLARTLLACVLAALLWGSDATAARVKDIAHTKGVRSNQLVGYGIVVGLSGTGDKERTEFTVRSLVSMLARMGITVEPDDVQVKNVAAVMVTASLTPFARTGSMIDAIVSSMGDATSLAGGTLVLTPLFGSDGRVYALAQGPVSVGGFAAGGGGGTSVQKNHPTVGRLANGATVERELGYSLSGKRSFEIALSEADFTTARRLANAINGHFAAEVARARDPGMVSVDVPERFAEDLVGFMAEVEMVEVEPDHLARVVLNERTGTVVMGEAVRVSTVAISHGNLSVMISTTPQVSQPAPFARRGETVVVEQQDVVTEEEEASLAVIEGPVTISDLVRGLNAMGATPRDLISILQAIKAAGALSADLELL